MAVMVKLRGYCARTVFVLFLVLCNGIAAATASIQALDVEDNGPIRVCLFEWYPYSFEREGEAQGIYVSLLRRVGWSHSLQFSIKPLPRCISELRQGKQDIWPYSGSSYDVLVHAEPVTQYMISGVIVPEDSEHLRFDGLQQFAGEQIGILRGSTLFPWLVKEKSIDWQPQNSGDSLWRMLLSQRLDGAVGDFPSLTTLKVFRQGMVRFLRPALRVDPLKIGVHRQREALLPQLNRALQQMLASGELDLLYRDFGAVPFSEIQQVAQEGTR